MLYMDVSARYFLFFGNQTKSRVERDYEYEMSVIRSDCFHPIVEKPDVDNEVERSLYSAQTFQEGR